MKRAVRIALAGGGVVVVVALAFAGRFVWREHAARAFSARHGPMNEHYKQALFLTGQGQREAAVREHGALVAALEQLRSTGGGDGLSADARALPDLERAAAVAARAGPLVRDGDLAEAHRVLEEIRPILNELLRRNGISPLKVALTDFHDAMERVIDAGKARSARSALAELPSADAKLRAVERELDDPRVQVIRTALERVRSLAEEGRGEALPDAVGALKGAFVKVYLVEG